VTSPVVVAKRTRLPWLHAAKPSAVARWVRVSHSIASYRCASFIVNEGVTVFDRPVTLMTPPRFSTAVYNCNGNVLENVNYAVKSQYLLRLLESVPEVASKLKPPGTVEKKSEDISSSAEKASVMILIYGIKL